METMKVGGRSYRVTGYVRSDTVPKPVSVLDIHLMSDERWHELSRKNAVENYTREFGRAPESVELAIEWQQERANRLLKEATA